MIKWITDLICFNIQFMSINSSIDEECIKIFDEIKFNKKYRYITYKVDNEKIVPLITYRSSNPQEIKKKIGEASSPPYPITNPECASLISNIKATTVWTAANCSSFTGCPTELPWNRNFPTPHSKRASRLNWTSWASRLSLVPLTTYKCDNQVHLSRVDKGVRQMSQWSSFIHNSIHNLSQGTLKQL